MDARLTIILRPDGHALGDELLTKLDIVDHIPIVRADHVTVRIEMGLGVDLRRLAKGRPAQLGDAALASHLREVIFIRDSLNLTYILAQIDRPIVQRGSAYRVIATVAVALRRFDQDRAELFFLICYVSEDTAHRSFSLWFEKHVL